MFDGFTGVALSTIDFTPPRYGKLNPTTEELKRCGEMVMEIVWIDFLHA
jgi:hypothetical protein